MYEAQFTGIKITQTRCIFARTASGKSWSKRPETTTTEEITARMYMNVCDPKYRWNGDRVERGYTYAGYLPIKVSNVSPDGNKKCVWSFRLDLEH